MSSSCFFGLGARERTAFEFLKKSKPLGDVGRLHMASPILCECYKCVSGAEHYSSI
jgi:hypothetical protein